MPPPCEPIAAKLLEQFKQSVLVEEFLPGREFHRGLVGEGKGRAASSVRSRSCCWQARSKASTRTSIKNAAKNWSRYRYVPELRSRCCQAEALALAAWRALRCRDAGRIDLRCNNAGEPEFLEANPLAAYILRTVTCRSFARQLHALCELTAKSSTPPLNGLAQEQYYFKPRNKSPFS